MTTIAQEVSLGRRMRRWEVLPYGLILPTVAYLALFLAIFILPLAISDLAAGLVWQSILTERGYLNTILGHTGLIDQQYIWLDPTKPNQLLFAVVVAEIWRSTAFVMVIFLAGLQAIPHEYGEAAEVFGAGFFQRVRTVILPMLKPSLQVALLFRIIFAFEAFAVVLAITGRAKTTLATEAWRWQADYFNSHVAAAYSALILVLSLISAGLVVWLLRTPKEQMLR